ncbi:MAG: SDR family NAD(P)-dependent oxidoreductase [Myxococcota bacterium]
MVDRGRGCVVLVSSMAALQGIKVFASYGAGKAYGLILGEGLWDELREQGVDALAYVVGATATPHYVEMQEAASGARPTEAQLAEVRRAGSRRWLRRERPAGRGGAHAPARPGAARLFASGRRGTGRGGCAAAASRGRRCDGEDDLARLGLGPSVVPASGGGERVPGRLRVVQCGTGIAGAEALADVLERDDLSSPACSYTASPTRGATRGVSSGSRIAASSRPATSRGSSRPTPTSWSTCCSSPSLDDVCAFLASGKNVVTTAGFMYPRWNAKEADRRLRDACERGGSSFYVTGINPGFVDEILPLTMSRLSRDWQLVHVREYADCSKYPSPAMLFDVMGFGKTPEDVAAGRVADMTVMTDFFAASVAALAHELGVELDEVQPSREFVLAPRRIETAAGAIEGGTIAGQRWRWAGVSQGVERVVQETFWIIAFGLGEGWPAAGEMEGDTRWTVTIEGTPSLRCVFEARASFAGRETGVNPSGVATAMAAVNSLASVVAAPQGLLTSGDLPQPRMRG